MYPLESRAIEKMEFCGSPSLSVKTRIAGRRSSTGSAAARAGCGARRPAAVSAASVSDAKWCTVKGCGSGFSHGDARLPGALRRPSALPHDVDRRVDEELQEEA